MPFKYQEEINYFVDFDFSNFTEKNRHCFRWVFSDITDERNFKPTNLLNNSRPQSCTGWALSFFISKDSASKRINTILHGKPQAYKKLGTHLAEGDLAENDGQSNDENEKGHFDHFEYIDVELSTKFTIVEQLIK